MNLQDIGARILHVRTEIVRLPQREFSQILGMGQGNMSKIEKGQSLPSCFFLASLHKTYRVNVNWILSGDGPVLAEPSQPDAGQTHGSAPTGTWQVFVLMGGPV